MGQQTKSANQSYTYITKQGQEALLNYAYHGSDASILSALLQPYWRFCVELLPMWMAPNLVTLIGFLVMFTSFLLTVYYVGPEHMVNENVPSWVFLSAAFSVFFYQTMDAIDGKQARRTGSSSALGELFDHGLDALTTMVATVLTGVAINVNSGWFALMVLFLTYLSAYMFLWEEYYTGVLRFGKFHSPTELQFLMIIIYCVTALNPTIWSTELQTIASLTGFNGFPSFIGEMSVSTAFLSNLMIFGIIGVFFNADAIRKDGGGLGLDRFLALFPVFFFSCSVLVWCYFSPLNIIENRMTFLCIILGLVFAYMSSRMVVDRVCKQPLKYFFFIHLPFPIAAVNAVYASVFSLDKKPFIDEDTLLYVVLLHIILVYGHFAYHVISDICDLLQIHCFRIAGENKKTTKTE